MRRHQHALVTLYGGDGDLLEGIQGEGPCARGLLWRLMLGDGDVVVVGRQRDLMAHLMRQDDRLTVLLRLESCGCSNLARLLCLEVVGDNGLWLLIAPRPLEELFSVARWFWRLLLGRIRHLRIFYHRG
jgi:hypothetical protein